MNESPNPTTPSYAMNAESKGGPVIGYMCRMDWEYEIGSASDGSKIYPCVADLKNHHSTAEECGIVQVEVYFRRIVEVGTDNE